MKIKLFSTVLSLAVLLLCSCEKNIDSNLLITDPSSLGNVIGLSQALTDLDDILIDINGDGTKSSNLKYSKSDITVIGASSIKRSTKSSSTENSLPDTLLYIVNFSDNGGFAVLSANTILDVPVLCVTESGSLSEDDFVKAISFIQNAQKFKAAQNEDEEFISIGKVFVPITIMSYATALIDFGKPQIIASIYRYDVLTKIEPFLKTRWDQFYPYNIFLNNPKMPAGCVAIATAQILAHNEIGKDNYNWTLLKTVGNINNYNESGEAKIMVSDFIQEVGNYENCRIRYNIDGSGGWADGAKRTFNNFRYKNVRKYYGFEKADKTRVNSHLSYGRPLYMDGSGGGFGHAWVIDGILVRNKVNKLSDQFIKREELYHINWGWGGTCNGYYTQGVFDVSERISIETGVDLPEGSNNDPSKSIDNYTWNYRTIIYGL